VFVPEPTDDPIGVKTVMIEEPDPEFQEADVE